MTPINLTVFLLSLILVDMNYTKNRINTYGYTHSDLPWFYPRWVARYVWPQPYQHVGGGAKGSKANERWHYHSKQKKLLKLEADEAFQMRSTILVLLSVVAALATSAVWFIASKAFYWLGPLTHALSGNHSMSPI